MPNHSPSRSLDPVSPSTIGRRPAPNNNNHRQHRVLSPLPSGRSNVNSNSVGGRRAFPTRPLSPYNNSNRNNYGYGGGGAASAPLSLSSVAFMITTKMKRILIEDLRYSRREVNSMSPDQAHQIVNNRISKPLHSNYNRIPTDKCIGDGDETSEECPISMTSPSTTTDIGSNRVLEEMDDQFGEVTERVLNNDNYGGPLFPPQQQQPKTNHHHHNRNVVPNEPLGRRNDRGTRRSNVFPSSTVYRW